MNVKIIKELGYGMIGTVYKVKYNNKYYAMKIEHILHEDKENKNSSIWKENDFMEKIASKYKNQFVKMYKYEFIDKCEHVQKYSTDLKKMDEKNKNKLFKLAESKICIQRFYELLDGSAKSLISTLDQNQIYSFIVQVAYIVNILEKHEYLHGDLHLENIGYIKTTKKFIYCDKIKVPTHGYIFKAIDFGTIMHKKDFVNNYLFTKELKKPLLASLINFDKFWEYVDNNNIKIDYRHFKNFKNWNISKGINDIFSEIKDEHKVSILRILYPEQSQKLMLGNKYTKTFSPILYVDIWDIIFIYKCNFNSQKIFDYFLEKL
jgi:hypothetical protein